MIMTNYRELEECLMLALRLPHRPVAVAFLDEPPAGVSRFQGAAPSGCSFWKLAQAGGAFYTVPSDHYNCPVGSYTHNISLPLDRAGEFDETLSLMAGAGYLKIAELPGIPRLLETPAAILYAALADTPQAPDVVIFTGRPGRLMLLLEAAVRAGTAVPPAMMGRPTCMGLPVALQQGTTTSFGCIGNRVYTELGEDEFYAFVRGGDLEAIAAEAQTIAAANAALERYHRERKDTLASL